MSLNSKSLDKIYGFIKKFAYCPEGICPKIFLGVPHMTPFDLKMQKFDNFLLMTTICEFL